MNCPVGTYLAKIKDAVTHGVLPSPLFVDPSQSFHFAAVKEMVKDEDEEPYYFYLSGYSNIPSLVKQIYTAYHEFSNFFGEEPSHLCADGFSCALVGVPEWKAIFLVATSFKFPHKYLHHLASRLSYAVTQFYREPSRKAASFIQHALVAYSKYMAPLTGVPGIINIGASPSQADSVIEELGCKELLQTVLPESALLKNCTVFVNNKVVFTAMDDSSLVLAEILANLTNTATSDYTTVDGRVFCVARHYTMKMVCCTKNDPLKTCCEMQVAMMNLDSKFLVDRIERSFFKKLPPDHALDVVVKAGSLIAAQASCYIGPAFVTRPLDAQAISIGALMLDTISRVSIKCVVTFKLDDDLYQVKFKRLGDAMVYLLVNKDLDVSEADPLPHMLRSIKDQP